MNLKRILATAIVWIGCAALVVTGMVFIWALVSAFIADLPESLYALIATPFLIAAIIGLALLGFWAWDNKWKP